MTLSNAILYTCVIRLRVNIADAKHNYYIIYYNLDSKLKLADELRLMID